jgi:hypothetical protein
VLLELTNIYEGGYTALSTKGVASMLSSTLWRALTTPVTYALLAVLVGTAVMQVKYVNKALARFDSTQVIPVQFVMFTLSVIIGSAILYRDFEKATPESVGKFIGGCLLTFFGVFLITSGRPRRDEEDEEESDEEGEERIGLANQEPTGEESMAQDGARRPSRPQILQNGDAANDEEAMESRRSSRVSFVDISGPRTPHRFSISSYQPSIRVVPSAPSELPAEETPLLSNPWRSSSEELLQAARHPGIPNTTSSPVLPSEAQISTESLKPPSSLPRTSSQGNVHTHTNYQHGPAPPQAERPITPARNSISRMMPGPFISPLSGGLSVVVADTLRRSFDSPSHGRFKRPRLGLQRSKSGSHRLSPSRDGVENELGTSLAKNSNEEREISKSLETDPSSNWARITRARSLSNTLGEYFRGKRQKTESREGDGDEEAGPSGS